MGFESLKSGKCRMNNVFISIWLVSVLAFTGTMGFFIFESDVASAGIIIYVDDDNFGFEDGSITNPFNTIQEGVDAASNGDTVYVFNGIYMENVLIEDKALNLIGEDKGITIIDGGGAGDVIHANGYDYPFESVSISGFTITNSGPTAYDGGIEFYHIQNSKIQNNIIMNNYNGIDITLGPSFPAVINITGNMIFNNYNAIVIGSGKFYNITNNTVINNDNGITMGWVEWSIIKGNFIESNGDFGINIGVSSRQIKVTDNHIYSHDWIGIDISDSTECTFTNNTMLNDGIFISGLTLEQWNTHNIDTSNTVNGKPIYYWKNQTGGSIPPGGGQAILANCTNVSVKGQEFKDGDVGIQLGYSSNCSIIGNDLTSNDIDGLVAYSSNRNFIFDNNASYSSYGMEIYGNGNNITGNTVSFNKWLGISLGSSNDNKITGNTVSSNTMEGLSLLNVNYNEILSNDISNNSRGLVLLDSTNNSIYHNNFIDNTNQVYDNRWDNIWDNGYPSGGNFWSDYDGVDLNSTPSQDVPPPDGIGDTPYIIDSDSQDNYPLMEPILNRTFLYEGWNLISIPFIQTDTNLGIVLNSIKGSYDAVQWYNVSDNSDPWKHSSIKKPSHLNDLKDINHSMGFWIHITKSSGVLFEYPGTQPIENQTVTLYQGWNLVGYPSLLNRNRTAALNNLTFNTQVNAIWTFNTPTQKWKELGQPDYFEVGKGYWIHATTDCEWVVPL